MNSAGEHGHVAASEPRERRDRPVEEEADKDIKEGGMAQAGRSRAKEEAPAKARGKKARPGAPG